MPVLKSSPTLKDYQQYIIALEQERGFSDNTILQECLKLGEEVGELFKAVRKQEKMKIDVQREHGSVDEELADVLIYLCSIANKCGIDLEEAFRAKEEINKTRVWK